MSARSPIPLASALMIALALSGEQAYADLTICNQTKQPAGLALAMQTGLSEATANTWTSLGWWTVEAGRCKAILDGPLTEHSYFLHALHYNVGGRWEGDESFCVDRGSFTIEGRGNCAARGFEDAKFLEIETEGKPDWQHTLLDQSDSNGE